MLERISRWQIVTKNLKTVNSLIEVKCDLINNQKKAAKKRSGILLTSWFGELHVVAASWTCPAPRCGAVFSQTRTLILRLRRNEWFISYLHCCSCELIFFAVKGSLSRQAFLKFLSEREVRVAQWDISSLRKVFRLEILELRFSDMYSFNEASVSRTADLQL